MTVVDTPAEGKTTYRYQHVVLGEPDAALFRVPDGMEIRDANAAPPPVKPLSNDASVKSPSLCRNWARSFAASDQGRQLSGSALQVSRGSAAVTHS